VSSIVICLIYFILLPSYIIFVFCDAVNNGLYDPEVFDEKVGCPVIAFPLSFL